MEKGENHSEWTEDHTEQHQLRRFTRPNWTLFGLFAVCLIVWTYAIWVAIEACLLPPPV